MWCAAGTDISQIAEYEGANHGSKQWLYLYLERIRFAHLTLDGLPRGEWRYLTDEEIKLLEEYGK